MRIPRFPIGAAWLEHAAHGGEGHDPHWDALPIALSEGTLLPWDASVIGRETARTAPVDLVRTAREGAPTLAARLLETPEPVAITTDRRGTPIRMFWRGRGIALTRAEGPERLSGEWWHAEPFARDYWRCESDELGQDLLLYRDSAKGGWRLQGWYD